MFRSYTRCNEQYTTNTSQIINNDKHNYAEVCSIEYKLHRYSPPEVVCPSEKYLAKIVD